MSTETKQLGNAEIVFEGEQDCGYSITDTEVKINDALICCISWQDKEAFAHELNAIINKYRI